MPAGGRLPQARRTDRATTHERVVDRPLWAQSFERQARLLCRRTWMPAHGRDYLFAADADSSHSILVDGLRLPKCQGRAVSYEC
jgi:hypothetical protein